MLPQKLRSRSGRKWVFFRPPVPGLFRRLAGSDIAGRAGYSCGAVRKLRGALGVASNSCGNDMKRESLDLLAQVYVLQLVLEMPATAVELADRLLAYRAAAGIATVRPLLRTLLMRGLIDSAARDGVGRAYFITEPGRRALDNSRTLLDTMFHRRPAGGDCVVDAAHDGQHGSGDSATGRAGVPPLYLASHAEAGSDGRVRQSSRAGI